MILNANIYINNSRHLVRKYARIFVRGNYLFREANARFSCADNLFVQKSRFHVKLKFFPTFRTRLPESAQLVWADSKVPGNFKHSGLPPAHAPGLPKSARKLGAHLVSDLTLANESAPCQESAKLV